MQKHTSNVAQTLNKRRLLRKMSDAKLIERAVAAYFRHARSAGVIYQQPSLRNCFVNRNSVILANSYGELARFKRCRKGLVRIPSE